MPLPDRDPSRPLSLSLPDPVALRQPAAAGDAIDSDVPPKGCAWFESSHELMRGLLVVEEPPGWRLVPRRSSEPGA